MRIAIFFLVGLLLTGGMLSAFDGAEWQTVARLVVKPGVYYFLDKNAENDYRLFLAAEQTALLLGKGVPDSRGIVFSSLKQTRVFLFTQPRHPELNGAAPPPGVLPFVAGYTFHFAEKAKARLGELAGRKSKIIAGSFKDNSILLEGIGIGDALPFFSAPSHIIYLEESTGRYRCYNVDKVSDENLIIIYAHRGKDETVVSIDWNEQGEAVGKIVLPDKTTALIDCAHFNAGPAHDNDEEMIE